MISDLKEGIDFYLNDKKLIVFTKEYHIKRGYCCKSSCKHCPYDFHKKEIKK